MLTSFWFVWNILWYLLIMTGYLVIWYLSLFNIFLSGLHEISFVIFYLWLVKLKGSAFHCRETRKSTSHIETSFFMPTQLGEPVLEMLAKPSRAWIGEWEDFLHFKMLSWKKNILHNWWCEKGTIWKKKLSLMIFWFTSVDAGFWKKDPDAITTYHGVPGT